MFDYCLGIVSGFAEAQSEYSGNQLFASYLPYLGDSDRQVRKLQEQHTAILARRRQKEEKVPISQVLVVRGWPTAAAFRVSLN